MGEIREGTSRSMYKGHMDKAKWGRFQGGTQEWVGWGRRCARCGKNGDNCT